MAPGMREVAEKAGVSIATVSNVLNRPQVVAEPTQERVREVMRDLGFVRNGSARQLRAGTSEVICVVFPGFSAYFDELTRGVEERASEHGLVVFACATNDDTTKEETYLRVMMEQRVRGILLTRASKVFQSSGPKLRRHAPVVLVDLESPAHDHCSTAADDGHGSEVAVKHLHDLGHRRIAWVGPTDVPQMVTRADSIHRTASDLGIEVLDVVTPPKTLVPAGQFAARELHDKGMPSAVICGNDLMAVGMEMELKTLGYSIPGDVSIVGYDDIEFAAAATVPLTTVARHPARLGAAAVDLLLGGCGTRDDHTHQQLVFPSELIVRSSTGPARSAV
ncbi:MAG: LacI family DNA-binding transcriptional regulator [Acidimicrobiia bacterium]